MASRQTRMLARRAASGGTSSRSRSRRGHSSSKTLPGDVVVFDAPRHSTRRVHDDDGVLAGDRTQTACAQALRPVPRRCDALHVDRRRSTSPASSWLSSDRKSETVNSPSAATVPTFVTRISLRAWPVARTGRCRLHRGRWAPRVDIRRATARPSRIVLLRLPTREKPRHNVNVCSTFRRETAASPVLKRRTRALERATAVRRSPVRLRSRPPRREGPRHDVKLAAYGTTIARTGRPVTANSRAAGTRPPACSGRARSCRAGARTTPLQRRPRHADGDPVRRQRILRRAIGSARRPAPTCVSAALATRTSEPAPRRRSDDRARAALRRSGARGRVSPGLPHPPSGHLRVAGHLCDAYARDGRGVGRGRTAECVARAADERAARHARAALRVLVAAGSRGHSRDVRPPRPGREGANCDQCWVAFAQRRDYTAKRKWRCPRLARRSPRGRC